MNPDLWQQPYIGYLIDSLPKQCSMLCFCFLLVFSNCFTLRFETLFSYFQFCDSYTSFGSFSLTVMTSRDCLCSSCGLCSRSFNLSVAQFYFIFKTAPRICNSTVSKFWISEVASSIFRLQLQDML